MTEEREFDDERRRFLEARQKGIGATDAAAILNLSPWSTPLKVYHDKVDPIGEADTPSLPMWLGLRLEDVVAELFKARSGLGARSDNRQHVHPEDPWLVCHLDYRVLGRPDELVECKIQNSRAGWGDEGTDDIPVHYWIQGQHEMLVTGAKVCHFAVLFGLYDFKTYRLTRDEQFFETWRPAARDFWHDHILAQVPPPLDGDAFSKKVVSSRWPDHDDTLKRVPPERELVILQLRESEQRLKAEEKQNAALRHRIEDLIGDSAGVEGSWGKITWRKIKDRTIVEWDKVADTLGAAIGNVLENVNPGDDEQAVRALALAQSAREAAVPMYTRIEPGYRRIDVRFKKDA